MKPIDFGLTPGHTPALRKLGIGPYDAAAGTHGVTGTAYAVPYTDADGNVVMVALGADGTVLTSTGVASAPAFEVVSTYTAKYTTADRTRNSDTLTDDVDLTVAVLANTTYVFEFGLFFITQSATSDMKMAFTCPASPTALIWGAHGATALTADPVSTLISTTYATASGTALHYGGTTANNFFISGRGTLRNGANAGSLTLQWADSVTDAANLLTLKQGSHLVLSPA